MFTNDAALLNTSSTTRPPREASLVGGMPGDRHAYPATASRCHGAVPERASPSMIAAHRLSPRARSSHLIEERNAPVSRDNTIRAVAVVAAPSGLCRWAARRGACRSSITSCGAFAATGESRHAAVYFGSIAAWRTIGGILMGVGSRALGPTGMSRGRPPPRTTLAYMGVCGTMNATCPAGHAYRAAARLIGGG